MARKATILAALRALLEPSDVIDDDELLRAYETDALTAYRQRPLAVVLPHSTAQVAALLQFAQLQGIRIIRAAPVPPCPAVPCRLRMPLSWAWDASIAYWRSITRIAVSSPKAG
jgi:hypothetical protein